MATSGRLPPIPEEYEYSGQEWASERKKKNHNLHPESLSLAAEYSPIPPHQAHEPLGNTTSLQLLYHTLPPALITFSLGK